jgi:nicotinic acid mononucleotide adenylyltransferase
MINQDNAKMYSSAETYKKIENYNKARKSKLLYICHHKDEIINNKTGRAIYTLEVLKKTPKEYIEIHGADELRGLGKYKHLNYKKLVFIEVNEHKRIHSYVSNLNNADNKKARIYKSVHNFSTAGITPKLENILVIK